ncbi:hypothetical protein ACJMK2_013477 [Sinanodonta woodiana]|uniref:C2H2-type domain-containing protein n=1 Tax=Sinanodonta woodiana TaxID=1069815 RepID=A0ABD3UXM7_SINWO
MTTRLITVKSLTNTRCRAYRCRKCPAEVAIVGEKSKVVSHIYKKHTALDQAQFYCSLCTHVRYYSAHREKADQLREMGCPVNEEANLFLNLHPYLPGNNDMEVLDDSDQIWRERSRQGEICSQLSTMRTNVQKDHELGSIITLTHPAAPMMLAEAERSSSRNGNSSAQSEFNFLDELLDYGSLINFSVGHLEISHQSHLAPCKTSVSCSRCCCDTTEELGKLVAGIDTLKDIMEKQVEMIRNNINHSTALMVNFTVGIQEQTSTYISLNNNITKMIEHLNDTKKPHPREDGSNYSQDKYRGCHQDRRDREQDKNETDRDIKEKTEENGRQCIINTDIHRTRKEEERKRYITIPPHYIIACNGTLPCK